MQKERFHKRHIGPQDSEIQTLLKTLEVDSLEQLIDRAVPKSIRSDRRMDLSEPLSEGELIDRMKDFAGKNTIAKSYIGQGYYPTFTPPVILRTILENPGWYTQYTPYQAEISQGRLEALLNFQTLVMDLTGLDIANASLLDEGTAAAEAMSMSFAARGGKEKRKFFVSQACFPQTIAVVESRAEPLGIEVVIADERETRLDDTYFGALLQYPDRTGEAHDFTDWISEAHSKKILVTTAADLMSLCLLKPPGEMGADICVGSTQRFGVPMGFGGPHAAYFATKDEFKRRIPGRIVGVSVDANGKKAVRLALQTREQHIRREKATSNICTAQVLLAIMASMYAVYHGPEGLKQIAGRIHRLTGTLKKGLEELGYEVRVENFFDTLTIAVASDQIDALRTECEKRTINLRWDQNGDPSVTKVGVSLAETHDLNDVRELLDVFALGRKNALDADQILNSVFEVIEGPLGRKSDYLSDRVFHSHRSEHQMLRYIRKLEMRDLSLAHSMIPLGSCTMKLNAAAEMIPVTWPEFAEMHPFAPREQSQGYIELIEELEHDLEEVTGFDRVSIQPNAGSQGEYAGLLVIRAYHRDRGEGHRNVCLIPTSAHGTNPASATMAGMKTVAIKCDDEGNIDIADLEEKAKLHSKDLAALMVTYPSTHGVFETEISKFCEIVHANGGQVYMDGANMNAQIGICLPGEYGPDVCHLNLHKTFCIPHGGGGPGVGPIGVRAHLSPYLPGHPIDSEVGGEKAIGPISAAPFGSPAILPISYSYIRMMGEEGLTKATQVAILNANYIAKRLDPYFPVLYKGQEGWVAHECIIDLRPLKASAGIEVEDVAKRLMDYGFHAPTISWPVAGTMMIEPTESEDLGEIERFCQAMISIREEVGEIEKGKADRENNVLKNAPHTASVVTRDQWDRPYSREKAAFPTTWVREHKFWPSVGRIDNASGDRNLFCSCAGWDDES